MLDELMKIYSMAVKGHLQKMITGSVHVSWSSSEDRIFVQIRSVLFGHEIGTEIVRLNVSTSIVSGTSAKVMAESILKDYKKVVQKSLFR